MTFKIFLKNKPSLTARQASLRGIEIWKSIPRSDYQVSNLGRVRVNNEVKHTHLSDGYPQVCIKYYDQKYYKSEQIHALVLLYFDGPKKYKQVCRHLDGTRDNNKLYNLKWGTYKENTEDSIKHSTKTNPPVHIQIGEKNNSAVLTENHVRYIRRTNKSAKTLAKELNITQWTVFDIRKGRSWSHIPL